MDINLSSVRFTQTGHDDEKIQSLLKDFNILQMLSERYLYPVPMPSSILFRIEKDNSCIGLVALDNIKWYNRKASLTLVIDPQFQGKGFGLKALHFICAYAFYQMNFHRLEAEVYDFNTRSILLLEKFGFIREGILREAKFSSGNYHHILVYGLLQNEYGQRYGKSFTELMKD